MIIFSEMDAQLAVLKADIEQYCPKLTEAEWRTFQNKLTPVSYKKGVIVFPSNKVCKHILFVSNGILASEYHNQNKLVISRFFAEKGLCSNLVSLLNEEECNDQLVTMTSVQGVLIPYQVFLESYLYSDGISLYFRKKLLNVLLEDKHFVSAKTISDVKYQLAFLQEHYPTILLEVPWKHIANFIGVTPAWLSRTLKKKEIKK
ncbi:MAG: hypothetical protein AAGB24_08370 [Bacteroidota bacterium]